MFRVRPLRLASFRAVLEQLAEDAPDAGGAALSGEGDTRPAGGWRSAPSLPFMLAEAGTLQGRPSRRGGPFRAYQDEVGFSRAPAETVGENDEERIAELLSLTPDLTPAQLSRLRRAFALTHHPDRVPELLRDRATRRMSIVNALIDQAMRSRASS